MLGRNLKNLWSYLEWTPSNFSKRKFSSRNRNSSYLGLKCLIWIVLGGSFKKLLSYWKSSLWNVKFQSFIQSKKIFKLGTKNVFVGKFRRIWKKKKKNDFHIWNQHLRISKNIKFHVKGRINCGPSMPYLDIFGLEFEKTIVCLFLKDQGWVWFRFVKYAKHNIFL